jgi:hypothetical protein
MRGQRLAPICVDLGPRAVLAPALLSEGRSGHRMQGGQPLAEGAREPRQGAPSIPRGPRATSAGADSWARDQADDGACNCEVSGPVAWQEVGHGLEVDRAGDGLKDEVSTSHPRGGQPGQLGCSSEGQPAGVASALVEQTLCPLRPMGEPFVVWIERPQVTDGGRMDYPRAPPDGLGSRVAEPPGDVPMAGAEDIDADAVAIASWRGADGLLVEAPTVLEGGA